MRSFGLVAALVLVGCTKPEPRPVASIPLAPAPQTVVVEPATVDAFEGVHLTASCDFPEYVNKQIALHLMALEGLNAQMRLEHTDRHSDVIEIQQHLAALVQRANNECDQKAKFDEQ